MAAFQKSAASKGFELVQLDADSVITLDYHKQFHLLALRSAGDVSRHRHAPVFPPVAVP